MLLTDPHLSTHIISRAKWLWICCPKTEDEVISWLEDPFDMFGSSAAWWKCPACGSWHISMIEELKDLHKLLNQGSNIDPGSHGLIFKTLTPCGPIWEKRNGS